MREIPDYSILFAVMLSTETAVGKYPMEAVQMMQDIINFTEKSLKA